MGRNFPNAKQFTDFREMLDQLGEKVDIVTVSTPDHTHASAAIRAMKMGKHVYCQKPLTWSIQEARHMREVAEETGVVTQMGNQGTSEDGLRDVVEAVRAGAIGDVTEVHIWTNRPVWPQGIGRPTGEDPLPKASTGMPGLVLPKCGPTRKVSTTRSIGAVGSISVRAPSAIWLATPPIPR